MNDFLTSRGGVILLEKPDKELFLLGNSACRNASYTFSSCMCLHFETGIDSMIRICSIHATDAQCLVQ